MKFSEMQYTRPDMDGLKKEYEALIGQLKASESYDGSIP